jgi:hypothetical protein
MDVQIGEITSDVRAIDADAMLSPRTMAAIIRAVLNALDDRDEHRRRTHGERRITRGVSSELEER